MFDPPQSIAVWGGLCGPPAISVSLVPVSAALYSSEREGCIHTYGAWYFNHLRSPWFISFHLLPTEVLRKCTTASSPGMEGHIQSPNSPVPATLWARLTDCIPTDLLDKVLGSSRGLWAAVAMASAVYCWTFYVNQRTNQTLLKRVGMCWAQQGPSSSFIQGPTRFAPDDALPAKRINLRIQYKATEYILLSLVDFHFQVQRQLNFGCKKSTLSSVTQRTSASELLESIMRSWTNIINAFYYLYGW